MTTSFFVACGPARRSRLVASLSTGRRVLKRIRRREPGAYLVQETIFR